MIAFLTPLIGAYPSAATASVIVNDPDLYYALETQSMSTFPDGVDEETVAHELTHQWFGDAVTVKYWRDLWLAEGFATYFEYPLEAPRQPGRLRPGNGGRSTTISSPRKWARPSSASPRTSSPTTPTTAARSPSTRCARRSATSCSIGRCAPIIARFRNGNATSQDFIDVAVEVSGRPAVRQLLNDWLYEEAVPPLPGRAARPWPLPRASGCTGRSATPSGVTDLRAIVR